MMVALTSNYLQAKKGLFRFFFMAKYDVFGCIEMSLIIEYQFSFQTKTNRKTTWQKQLKITLSLMSWDPNSSSFC